MRFTLVAPALAAAARDAASASRVLARIATWSTARTPANSLEAASVQALGVATPPDGRDVPIAPALALGAGLDAGASYVLAAEPVNLVAGRDDVRLAARVDDLDANETASLAAALSAHFAPDGIAFHAPRASAIYATMAARPALATVPLAEAIGDVLSAHPPRGDQARTWLRWTTEIQMLLHAHPLNATRERAGRPPVNGLWFWGGGTLADLGLLAPFRAHVEDVRAGDLVRGLARHSGGEVLRLPAGFDAAVHAVPATRPAAHVVVVLPAIRDAATFTWAERGWLAPAADALGRGRIASLALVTDRGTWTVPRPGPLARLRARFAPRRFADGAP